MPLTFIFVVGIALAASALLVFLAEAPETP
jgi:hypothetical protein